MSSSPSRNRSSGKVALAVFSGACLCLFAMFHMSAPVFVGLTLSGSGQKLRPMALTRHAVLPAVPETADRDVDLQNKVLAAVRQDFENLYTDGFTFIPFAVDVAFIDPIVRTEGRLLHNLAWTPTLEATKLILDSDSLKMSVKSIEVVPGDYVLSDVPHPPRGDGPESPRSASFAIKVIWETYGDGRVKVGLPNDFKIVDQKRFFMSGEDVFRVDSKGQVFRHESGWDQHPMYLMNYMNPLAHLPSLEPVLPFFAELITTKSEELPEGNSVQA